MGRMVLGASATTGHREMRHDDRRSQAVSNRNLEASFQGAEIDVMRSTATPTGGRVPTETLIAYVNRTRDIQQAAVDRALFAESEIRRLKNQGEAS